MITNANRSGSLKVKSGERDVHPPTRPQDEVRSGKVSERAVKERSTRFGKTRQQKIVSVDGKLELVDAH